MDINLKGGGMPGIPTLPRNLPMLLLIVGVLLIGFGLLLLANEWLLRYLVAGVFILLGGLVLLIGARAKRMLG
ncbi:MAG: hypothetical protein ACI89X_004019 [Planctomycetota bacterium]|jgi:hypothetical protein